MRISDVILKRLYEIRAITVDVCQECGGAGYVPDETHGSVACNCMQIFQYVMELVIAGVPMRYWNLSLSELKVHKDYKTFIRNYISKLDGALSHGLGVLFLGENGTGKTTLMCEVGKAAVIHGGGELSVQYFTAQQYVDAVKSDLPIRAVYDTTQVHLFDELDKVYIKRGSNFVIKTLEQFFRKALSDNHIIIACTNLDAVRFTEIFGDSTVSMLKRHLQFLEIAGKDFSDTLQDEWGDLLNDVYDYYHPVIVKAAGKFNVRYQEVESGKKQEQPTR